MLFDALQAFTISLLVGLGVGIERERHQTNSEKSLGVRSFALIALCGTLLERVHEPTLTLGVGLAIAALLAISYWRSSDPGLTTELAGALVLGLGYLAGKEPTLVAIIGVVVATLLFSRQRLHFFSQHLSKEEMRAALILAAAAIVILPFLPDRAIDPWALFNPRRFAQIGTLIMMIEFGGYVVERVAGARIGALATGFFGGLASSTAVFVGLPKQINANPAAWPTSLGTGLMATSATVCLYVAVIYGAAPDLGAEVALPAALMALLAAGLGVLVARRAPAPSNGRGPRRSPLDLLGAIKLTVLVAALFTVTLAAKKLLGSDAVRLLAFIGGLFELQSVSFATASLYAAGGLAANETIHALLLSLLASFVTKIALCWMLRPGRFAAAMTALLLIIALAGWAAAQMVARLVH